LGALRHHLQLQKGSLKRRAAAVVPLVFQQVRLNAKGRYNLLAAWPLQGIHLLHDRRAVRNPTLRTLLPAPVHQRANHQGLLVSVNFLAD
jgi:hypothetical protein